MHVKHAKISENRKNLVTPSKVRFITEKKLLQKVKYYLPNECPNYCRENWCLNDHFKLKKSIFVWYLNAHFTLKTAGNQRFGTYADARYTSRDYGVNFACVHQR